MSDSNKKNNKGKISSWWAGVKAEFGKIVWLDRASLGKQVVAVVIITVILSIIIGALDFGIQHGVDFLVNL